MPAHRIEIGDPVAPFTQFADFPAGRMTFDMLGGTSLLVAFLPHALSTDDQEALRALPQIVRDLPPGSWHVLVVRPDAPPSPQTPSEIRRFNTVFDADGTMRAAFGLAPDAPPVWFELSPTQRVSAITQHTPAVIGELCATFARKAIAPRPRMPAPVLHLPDVLEPALCATLIDYYTTHDPRPSMVMTADRSGKPAHVLSPAHKLRRDCTLRDRALVGAVQTRIIRRVVPEIFKAFRFQATQMDRMLLSAYDAADGGFFAPHRDNTIASSAHRQFAVSITLNDEFTGGELVFPEFGDELHRVGAGGAVVFSCALMHAVRRVETGCRYAFLPFVY